MERKLCADCGSTNLESENRCWACGGLRFAPVGAPLAGEPTLAFGAAAEPTISWGGSRRPDRTLVYAGSAAAFALLMVSLGFWIGRVSVPVEAAQPAPSAPALGQPMALPTPPTGLRDASTVTPPDAVVPLPDPQQQGATAQPAPRVTVRAGASPPAVTPPSWAPATGPVPPAPTLVRPRRRPRGGAPATTLTPPPSAPMAAPPAPAVTPPSDRGIVALRNDDSQPVEITLDGTTGHTTATLAAGTMVPVTLAPGTYTVRAGGRGATSGRSSLSIAANRTYSIAVSRRQDGSRDALMLIEPAIDGR